jgi:hypothetical protein
MNKLLGVTCALALLGCGKKDDKDKGAKPEVKPPAGSAAVANGGTGTAPEAPKPAEKPAPPADTFKGKVRVVNLLVDRAGKSQAIDVWAKRSFEHGPVRLAENIALGAASPWFATPAGHSIVIVPTGAGPDARDRELGGLSAGAEGEMFSHTLTLNDGGAPTAGLSSFKAAKPAAGQGLVVLEAGAFMGHAEAFKPLLGAWGYAFKVGDGTACRTGRQKGLDLGGTSYVDYEVPPGKATFTLHMGDDYECKKPAVYTISVDATADTASMVHVYTPDAKTITHVVLPLEL